MSATGAARVPRPSAVSMGALLAAGAAASAVSTPPAREHAPDPDPVRDGVEGAEDAEDGEEAAPESEAA
ncbi:hypothetical protein OHA37_14880 [Streptomyces sp. NBC_00335]|uniref:hypothetical protein n=1 Tax=unclassified Streptomyces TaxID=2593676 RepID=UPI002253E986|nr:MULTISPECIES: hypothetical protein [unclassified Streptomyces]MCX5405167.1 hypothetical protein [Streptomyces sp. NBC_00086]